MNNQKYESFWSKYIATESEQEQWDMTKTFLLSCSLPELMEWNSFLSTQSDAHWKKVKAEGGLSDNERQSLIDIHDKYSELMDRMMKERAVRKAA